MSRFLETANDIFESARQGGLEDCCLALLVEDGGAIRVVDGGDWHLECLRLERGARAAYGVSRVRGRVTVEARAAGHRCTIRSEAPELLALGLTGMGQYQLIS